MIIIGCGECGGKYQLMETGFDSLHCPSCKTVLPEKFKTSIKNLIDESKNRPNWKLFIELGNMFNTELTIRSRH